MFEIIKGFLFGSPFVMTGSVFRLVEGQKQYRPMSEEEYMERERKKAEVVDLSKQQEMWMMGYTGAGGYEIRRSCQFYLEQAQTDRLALC